MNGVFGTLKEPEIVSNIDLANQTDEMSKGGRQRLCSLLADIEFLSKTQLETETNEFDRGYNMGHALCYRVVKMLLLKELGWCDNPEKEKQRL